MQSLAEIKYNIPQHLQKFAGSKVPKEQKVVAARGMLPLPPGDLVQVLFVLTYDQDKVIKDTATKSLAKMPENILKNVAENKETHPLILHFLAKKLDPDSNIQEFIALNPATHDDTIAVQASYTNKKVIDIISQNQIRILRNTRIVDNLAENVLTGQAQLDRILKFIEMETRRSAKKAGAEAPKEKPPEEEKPEEQAKVSETPAEDEDVATVTEPDEDEIGAVTIEDSPWARMTFDEDLLTDHKTETEEEEEIVETNLFKKIGTMGVSEKIKLALMGGAQARSILIKDSNKLVATSVLKSPRITDNEVEGLSRSRSLNEDVIRIISNNKEWTKSYQVKLNLVQNPKTPLANAMRMMNFLRDKDLRDLSKSKNVPSQIATQAKRMLQRKEQKSKPGGKH